jgi:hypothetical protein
MDKMENEYAIRHFLFQLMQNQDSPADVLAVLMLVQERAEALYNAYLLLEPKN